MPMIGQKSRLITMLVYVFALFSVQRWVTGVWLPSSIEDGLWLYSAATAVVLGNLLVTPFFARPADSVAYSVTALIALFTAAGWDGHYLTQYDEFAWWLAAVFNLTVLGASALAIAFRSPEGAENFVSKYAYAIGVRLGTPTAIYSSVIAYSIFTFHREPPDQGLIILATWIVLVFARPVENAISATEHMIRAVKNRVPPDAVGLIVGHHSPNVVLFQESADKSVKLGDMVETRTEQGVRNLAVVLDHVGYSDGNRRRALILPSLGSAPTGSSYSGSSPVITKFSPTTPFEDEIFKRKDDLLGIVAPTSEVDKVQIKLIRDDIDLRSGRIVSIQSNLGEKPVLYQIVNGVTREEIVESRNRNGFVIAQARKLGTWDAENHRFEPALWVPNPNSPVFIEARSESDGLNSEAIGSVPESSFPIDLSDPHKLVSHNTAILGVLGSGKSYLALELIERLAIEQVKSVCIDLTDQYVTELGPWVAREIDDAHFDSMKAAGSAGRRNFKMNKEEGGSVTEFRTKLREYLRDFMEADNPRLVTVINPSSFRVWQQTGGMFNGEAAMASLTPAQITSLISEELLALVQEQGLVIDEKARCCLVLEEAHSLVPEFGATVGEHDQQASNSTARAVMQGRKYGFGTILVTQRTASVTKSILNQCNTVFALRIFDATGKEFLSNYLGKDYSDLLSQLPDRHAVAYGSSLSSRDPILIQLNDREEFLRSHRPPVRESPQAAETEVPGGI